jgi:hypothetical protein
MVDFRHIAAFKRSCRSQSRNNVAFYKTYQEVDYVDRIALVRYDKIDTE